MASVPADAAGVGIPTMAAVSADAAGVGIPTTGTMSGAAVVKYVAMSGPWACSVVVDGCNVVCSVVVDGCNVLSRTCCKTRFISSGSSVILRPAMMVHARFIVWHQHY